MKNKNSNEQTGVNKNIDLKDVTIYASYEVDENGKYIFSADD